MKNVIVIGAGISGLSLAARLLHKGFSVTIYEKNSYIGGKTSRLEHSDFSYDLTASIVMIPEDYTNIFKHCGKNYKDYFTMTPLNTLYKVFYNDNTSYEFHSNIPKLCNDINKITTNTSDKYGYLNFLSSNYKKYLLAEENFLNKSFIKCNSLLNFNTLHDILKTNSFISSYKDCSKYITDNKLKDFLMFQTMYVGVSPYSSPSIYNLIPAISQLHGLFHICGGVFSYVKALKQLVLDLGGNIVLNSEVNKIIIKNNKACGVKINNHSIHSDIVVASSDYCYTINNLINKNSLNADFKNCKTLVHSCSVFMLYLALDKKYTHLSVHNIFINKDFKDNIEAPFQGFLPFNPSIYIYCPSTIDNNFAPKGYEVMNIMVRVPNLLYKNIVWNKKTICNYEKIIINSLKNIKEFYDIESHIVEKNYLTPIDIKNNFNTYGGSAFGLSHTLKQSLIFRPQCKSKEIKKLYFTGASIHPGNGISMVLKSSQICSKVIFSENSQ